MKNLVLLSAIVFLFFGCGNQSKKQQEAAEPVVVLTVDELYGKAAELADKEIVVKGTVMHVCKEGGARCFLMGSELEIVGILKEVKTEADAHNPGAEHGAGEEAVDSARATAHQIIAAAQDSVEVVYFIEGLAVKELPLETK